MKGKWTGETRKERLNRRGGSGACRGRFPVISLRKRIRLVGVREGLCREGTLASPPSCCPTASQLPPWATQASPPHASSTPAPTGKRGSFLLKLTPIWRLRPAPCLTWPGGLLGNHQSERRVRLPSEFVPSVPHDRPFCAQYCPIPVSSMLLCSAVVKRGATFQVTHETRMGRKRTVWMPGYSVRSAERYTAENETDVRRAYKGNRCGRGVT